MYHYLSIIQHCEDAPLIVQPEEADAVWRMDESEFEDNTVKNRRGYWVRGRDKVWRIGGAREKLRALLDNRCEEVGNVIPATELEP